MMATLRYGSQGDDVKRLQRALGINADGIYGAQTQAAVKNYQQKNGLTVDGIAGTQTLGRLYGGGTTAQAAATAQETTNPEQAAPAQVQLMMSSRGTSYNPAEKTATQADLGALEAAAPTYQQTQALTDALNQLQARMGAKPAEYVSPYQDKLAALYEQATAAREPFRYDPNGDPLYQMYKDRYTQNARQAMQDTMADAAALTGGYGNSYAAAAAQQAYDEQMNRLNDALPELYGQAYDRWRSEGDDIVKRLQLMQEADQTEYGRYSDRLADYYDQLNAERTLANDMYDREYGQYRDALDAWQADRGYYWDKEQAELAQRNYENELAMQLMAGSGGGGSGRKSSGGSGTSGDYKTISKAAAGMDPKAAYAYIGRMVDGGYITADEGEKILSVELGMDLSQYAGSGNGNTSLIAPLAKNVTQKTAEKGNTVVGKANAASTTTAQATLDKLYKAAGINANEKSTTAIYNKLLSDQAKKKTAKKK